MDEEIVVYWADIVGSEGLVYAVEFPLINIDKGPIPVKDCAPQLARVTRPLNVTIYVSARLRTNYLKTDQNWPSETEAKRP